MSYLARAARPMKGVDQAQLASESAIGQQGHYIPLEELQRWTGMGISAQTALNYIAVYQCVRVLSSFFSQLPLKLYRHRAGGGKDEATDHPLYRTLHLQPNPSLTSVNWRKITMRDLATWGNHFDEMVPDSFGRLHLFPIRPEKVEVRWAADGITKEFWYLGGLFGKRMFVPGSVFHMQGQTTNGLVGSSPIADLRTTLSLARSAERYGTSLFDNNARPAVVLSHPKTLSEGAITRLTGQMDELRGAGNAGKTVILEEDLKVTPIGFPPEDAEFLATRLTQHRLIYGAYGIPPHKVGDLERATFSNIEHQAIEFVQDGGVPWLVNAEQEYQIQLIEEDDVFAEFLVDGYLRGDAKSRAEALQIRRQNGTLSADEWRELENENPIPDGLGGSYWMPVNMAPVTPAGAEVAADEQAGGTKSVAAEVRCPSCNKLLIEMATPPYRATCPRCKAVTESSAPPRTR